MSKIKFGHFFRHAIAPQDFPYRFPSSGRIASGKKPDGKLVGLAFKFPCVKKGLLVQPEAAESGMKPVVCKFVRANKALPMFVQLIMDNDKSSPQYAVV
jgi:hypothetical protein